jgi:hypothetical protein
VRLKTLLIAAAALTALAAGLLVAALLLVDWNEYRGPIARALSAGLGREVRIEGDLGLRVGLFPRLTARDVSLAGGPDAPDDLAQFERFEFVLDPWRLFFGTLLVRELRLEGGRLAIETGALEGGSPAPGDGAGSEPTGSVIALRVQRARFERVEITTRNETCGSVVRTTVHDASVQGRGAGDGRTVHVAAKGDVNGVGFDLEGEVGSLGAFVQPDGPVPLSLTGKVLGADVELEGEIERPALLRGVALDLSARAPSLETLAEAAGRELPPLGPVALRAHIVDDSRGRLGTKTLEVRIGGRESAWLELDGTLEQLTCGLGVDMKASFGAAALHHLHPIVSERAPDVGPVSGSARVRDRDGSLGVETFEMRGGRDETLQIEIAGKFDDIRELAEIDVRATLQARDLAALGDVLGAELPAEGPVRVAGRLTGSGESAEIRNMSARVDQTELRGWVRGSYAPGSRPSVTAELRSPHVHLDDIGLAPRARAAGAERAGAARRPTLLGDDPLPFESLRKLDARVALRAERVTGAAGLHGEALRVTLALEDGLLTLMPFEVGYEGGTLRGEARVDARAAETTLSLSGRGTGVDVGKLLAQRMETPSLTGTADLAIDVEGRGASGRQIASSLGGRTLLVIEDGTIDPRYANALTLALLQTMLKGKKPESTRLNCLIADLDIEKGVATAGTLLLDSLNVVLLGSGKVDLGAERFDLEITPRTKDRRLYGRSTPLLSAMVPVKVTGPLNDPTFTPDLVGTVGGTARNIVGSVVGQGTGAVDKAVPFVELGRDRCEEARKKLRSWQPEVASGR